MHGDERGFRVALVAAELVNPPAGGLDALAVLEAEGWGVVQLPAAWYPDDVAAPLLEHVAEQVDEFARHRYAIVLVGDRAGLAEALRRLDRDVPPALPAPESRAELEAFLQSRSTVAPRSAAS